MAAMSFQEAFDYLRRYTAQPCEDEHSVLLMDALVMEAEATVLDHQPRAQDEALMMIDTLIDNLATGARSDQRDIGALTTLQAWLARSQVIAAVA